jgi:hypothetical protein
MLVLFHDFEYSPQPRDLDEYVLVTDTTLSGDTCPPGNTVPLLEPFVSPFEGQTWIEIDKYVVSHENDFKRFNHLANDGALYVIVDGQGVQDETCLIVERGNEEDEFADARGVLRLRAPWIEAHNVLANLEIANMSMGDYTEDWDDGLGAMDDQSEENDPDPAAQARWKATKAARDSQQAYLKALQDLGHA